MQEHNGIGISAPQIGSNKRFFWMKDEFVVDPKIIKISPAMFESIEGCLSLPKREFRLLRSPAIVVEYYTLIGLKITRLLTGVEAVIFQHEFDHLFGVMIDEKAEWCSDRLKNVS